ncbi:MAG: undecaprenyl-phosphate 4-deoxy-4-formamido-L-arabinose transferase, partial [Candidatus Scalindua sp.]
IAASLSGIGFGIYIIAMRIIMGSGWAVEGVFTLVAVLFFFVGTQFLAFGLLGEYIGRIYSEVRKRPRFVIEKIYSREEEAYY